MRRSLSKTLSVIGCANGNAGRQLGCENAVNVLKNSKILDTCRIPIQWKKVVDEVVTGRHLAALPGVTQMSRQLAAQTCQSVKSSDETLVLGGDHSCAIGTWSGVAAGLREKGDIGLIWVDAHMDAHVPGSSDTGNIHGMPVAHLLGLGDVGLTRVGDRLPKILPHNMCMVGIRSYERPEKDLLEKMGVRVFYMDEVKARGITEVMQEAQDIVTRKTVGYGMSIDIDGFDVECAPAVGTPEANGINSKQFLHAVMQLDLRGLIATEIVEFLPRFDDDWKTSERLVVNLIETIYLTKFFQQQTTAAIEERISAQH